MPAHFILPCTFISRLFKAEGNNVFGFEQFTVTQNLRGRNQYEEKDLFMLQGFYGVLQ